MPPPTLYDSDNPAEDGPILSNTTRSFEASIHASLIRKSQKNYKYDSQESGSNESCGQQCCSFLRGTKFLLCTSHTLASWGNRMWTFAVGLFMIYLSQTSLRLTAIFGFVSGGAIMFFGPVLGDLVDNTARLKFARNILFVIDSSIALSAVTVCLTVVYEAKLVAMWNGWAMTLCHVVIVTFAVVANTASVGRMIAIERDWIVVMVKDKYELTALSALLRRIDLVTNLLAPVITGQLFTYGSIIVTSVFIAAWNVCFVFVEYFLLYWIYKRVPDLALPKRIVTDEEEQNEKTPLLASHQTGSFKSKSMNRSIKKPKSERGMAGCCKKAFSVFITLFGGWGVYVKEETVLAGMALGFTFMTVLGFDNVTTGFAIEEGLTSSIFGLLSGVGSLVGVLGTIAFPVLRKKIGLLKTGQFAFFLEMCLLLPCVVSVFLPGTLFDYDFLWATPKVSNLTTTTTLSPFMDNSTVPIVMMSVASNVTVPPYAQSARFPPPSSYWSVCMLMVGIITSRFGLWMADLTVTQLLIETPAEHQRGVVNGVQNAINRTWDLTKFLLVVFLPWPQTFGYLIILTFIFILLANLCFWGFSHKARKHGYQVLSDEKEREEREKQTLKQNLKYTSEEPNPDGKGKGNKL